MDCLLADVFAARSGGAVSDVRMVVPPPGVGAVAGAPPPGSAKATYGEDFAFHIDTANFTVQWNDPAVEADRAEALSAQLEAAWEVLIGGEGWPAPVSSDRYRIWVVLDPELGASGYTTTYASAAYPEGYPVIYLDPGYEEADRPDYALSVAVHEFGHAVQFGIRAWEVDLAESWYWEASAEWMAERGAPDLDMYALSTWWYAADPAVAFDSPDPGHVYGMVLLNAWLEAAVSGDAFARAWWEHDGAPWEEVLAGVAERPFSEVIAGMSGAYAAEGLRESAIYTPPTYAPVEAAGVEDVRGRLGTFYYAVPEGVGPIEVTGEVVATYAVPGGAWGPEIPDGAYRMAVTTLNGDGSFAYAPVTAEAPAACGCASGRPVGWGWLAGAVIIRARRARAAPR